MSTLFRKYDHKQQKQFSWINPSALRAPFMNRQSDEFKRVENIAKYCSIYLNVKSQMCVALHSNTINLQPATVNIIIQRLAQNAKHDVDWWKLLFPKTTPCIFTGCTFINFHQNWEHIIFLAQQCCLQNVMFKSVIARSQVQPQIFIHPSIIYLCAYCRG